MLARLKEYLFISALLRNLVVLCCSLFNQIHCESLSAKKKSTDILLTETLFVILAVLVKFFAHFYTYSIKTCGKCNLYSCTDIIQTTTFFGYRHLEHFIYDGYQYSVTSINVYQCIRHSFDCSVGHTN